jgi:hypothetical protein
MKPTNTTNPTHAPLAQAVAPGPEGRQMIAQRVSAGFRPPMNTQPQRGDRFPASSHSGQQLPARTDSSRPLRSRRKDAKRGKEWHPVFVPSPLRVFASSREPSQLWDEISREGTKRRFHLMFSRAPPARNSFSRRDAEPAEVGLPFITAFLDAR